MTSSSTSRTYLFALVDMGGTVPPEVGAARRLVDRGHRVTILGEDTMAREVAEAGATFKPWTRAPNRPTRRAEDDVLKDWECKTPGKLANRFFDRLLVGPAPDYAADVMDAVADDSPDVVVCSFFALGAMMGAEASGKPFDVLFPNTYHLPAEGLPPMGGGLRPARGRAGRLRDRVLGAHSDRVTNKCLGDLNEVRSSLSLEPIDAVYDQMHRARRHLVMTSQDFEFPATFPEHVRFVGPILDDPEWAGDDGWTPPPGDGPLILVGMSSTYQDHVGTLQRVADALGTLPVRGLVTTGLAIDPGSVHAPRNVDVVSSVAHAGVLPHTDLVVTHGGHGTVVRALAAGVPLVVIPHGRDQGDNAVRVTERGAGRKLRRRAKPRSIAQEVTRVLDDPAYRAAAERLGESLRRDAADGALVRELEDLPPRTHQPEHIASEQRGVAQPN